jgi:hypothetical protein
MSAVSVLAQAPDGQVVPANSQAMTHASCGEMLKQLGYEVNEIKAADSLAWSISVDHKDGPRSTLVGIDPNARTMFVISGGFSQAPDPGKGTNAWFRKLLKHNHQIAPSYIFVNDNDVFGLSTVTGNQGITNKFLRERIDLHVTNFNDRLIPLINELLMQ